MCAYISGTETDKIKTCLHVKCVDVHYAKLQSALKNMMRTL